jgi:protein ImuB
MDRMACVDLPSFPLQLLLKRHPDWRTCPAVVVDADKPQGVVLWVNELARSFRILPGMRYAAALTLAGDLRAASVPSDELERTVRSIVKRLVRFTPGVEPSDDEPGVFWLDASGLERLHDSLSHWAELILSDLKRVGLRATVAVGFSRFGTYAAARSKRGVVAFRNRKEEHAVARLVPLDRLSLKPAVRDTLRKLGIDSVGGFLDLPPAGLEKRFGAEIRRLHRLATDALQVPLQPSRPEPPATERLYLDHPETNVGRLMRVIERLLHPLLEILASRCQLLAGVHVGFRFEHLGDHIEHVRPAAPTLDAAQLFQLILLRLEAIRKLPDGVVEVVLMADGVAATKEQKGLFTKRPRRDLAAANRALARVRAELGNDTVLYARLREGHLPEGSYTWEVLDAVAASRPRDVAVGQLVRRIYARPIPLPSRLRQEPDGWMLRGLQQGPVVRVQGPYIVAGGWWNRKVQREYHFAETQKGDLLWVYYDRARRRWFLHGRVE